jgi:hypothetical protein
MLFYHFINFSLLIIGFKLIVRDTLYKNRAEGVGSACMELTRNTIEPVGKTSLYKRKAGRIVVIIKAGKTVELLQRLFYKSVTQV